MPSLRPLALLVLPVLTIACEPRPSTSSPDVKVIQDNYAFKHPGDCNSWLTSPVSGYKYCASPPQFPDVPPIVVATSGGFSLKEGPTDTEALRAHGEKVYTSVCQGCHQADGKGLAGNFPPLAGAGGFYGDAANHARIIVHGLNGPITVAGQSFNGAMPPQGGVLTDYDIAAVATYERTSWGNADGPVLPEVVASVR